MNSEKRASFKRNEVFQVGAIIEEHLTAPGVVRAYKPGSSDATVAEIVSKRLDRQLTASDIQRLRHQTHGKLAGESRPTPELLQSLTHTISTQAVAIKRLTDRVDSLERLLDDDRPRLPPNDHAQHGGRRS